MLVGTDVCVRMFLVWEETGVPGGNPPVWPHDHLKCRRRVSNLDHSGECVNTAPARQPWQPIDNTIMKKTNIINKF